MILRRAVVLALLAGCVVPPDIQQARPAPSNQPPFVLRAWPEPGVIRLDYACQPLIFTLEGISDCDAEDTVSVRWFVNYDPYSQSQSLPFKFDFRGGPGTRQCVRNPGSDSYQLPSRTAVPDGEILQVEAVLSDGFADSTLAPAYRATVPGKALTRIGWTVELYQGIGCPP